MSADYERKLHRAVAQFVKEADKKYPNWSERNDNGEWEIGLDKFDDMYKVILEIIEYTSCDEATEQMLDDILFGIARDNECSRIIEVLLKYPDWYALQEILWSILCQEMKYLENILQLMKHCMTLLWSAWKTMKMNVKFIFLHRKNLQTH